MSDDGSITVARRLRDKAYWLGKHGKVIDLRPILGIDAMITSPLIDGAADAANRLAVLIDPTTHQMPDGSCERCGAPAAALADAYCAHCGRRVIKEER